ncbi:MAG: hypothetical protein Q8Q09_22285 [Deltaproteobacteria bacterium]|nr:hypothetical protein [Deltaproteobacteria bacterium]
MVTSQKTPAISSKTATPVTSKTSALDRDMAPRALSTEERAVLTEAISRSKGVQAAIDSQWVEFGQWLFTNVFGEDTRSAIEHRDDNPLWSALFALADSAKVRVRHEELERALLTAAYDKRLNSDAWRALDYGRKWRLLRLADEKLLRKAASHVLSANLDTRAVDAYVRNVLAEEGETPVVRVSVPALVGLLDRLSDRTGSKGFGRLLESAAKKLTHDKREALLTSLESARDALDGLHARIKKSSGD